MDPLILHDMVCEDSLEDIKKLVILDNGRLLFQLDEDLNSPLHTIFIIGHKLTIEKAAILLGVSPIDPSPAICNGLMRLLEHKNRFGYNILMLACKGRDPKSVSFVLRCGVNAFEQHPVTGNSCLHLIAIGKTDNAIEAARILLDVPGGCVLLKMKNKLGCTPVQMAKDALRRKMVAFLEERAHDCE